MKDYLNKLLAIQRRNRTILKSYKAGKSLAEIARQHGISRQRVDVIVKRETAQ